MPPSADSALPAATDELAAAAAAAAAAAVSRSRPRAQRVREIATPGERRAAKAHPRYEQESHGTLQGPSSAWVNHRECCTVQLPLALELELELEPQRVYSSSSLLVGGSLASPRDLSAVEPAGAVEPASTGRRARGRRRYSYTHGRLVISSGGWGRRRPSRAAGRPGGGGAASRMHANCSRIQCCRIPSQVLTSPANARLAGLLSP